MITEVIKSRDGHTCCHSNGMKSLHSEYFWLSTDEKPYAGVENADVGYEMDTQKAFLFDAENKVWIEQ